MSKGKEMDLALLQPQDECETWPMVSVAGPLEAAMSPSSGNKGWISQDPVCSRNSSLQKEKNGHMKTGHG